MRLLLSTRPGLEHFVAAELADRGVRGAPTAGGVVAESSLEAPCTLRVVDDVVELWGGAGEIRELDDVRVAASQINLPSPKAASFRVDGLRWGHHPFDRIALERAVGGALHRRWGLPVSLERPGLRVRAHLCGQQLWVGRLVQAGLGRRPRPFGQRVSLSPVVAAAMIRFSELEHPRRVLDPCCGAGTLLVEAGHRWSDAVLAGGDRSFRAAEGCRQNLEAAGFAARARVAVTDALVPLPSSQADLVVSNPPFGLQLGRGVNFFRFYRKLLRAVRSGLSPAAKVVLLIHRAGAFEDAARAEGFTIEASHRFEMGSTRPTMIRSHP